MCISWLIKGVGMTALEAESMSTLHANVTADRADILVLALNELPQVLVTVAAPAQCSAQGSR